MDKYLYQEWEDGTPLVTASSDATSYALIDDVRKQVFQPSLKEILHMTYQNLWNKFLGEEMSLQLANGAGETDIEGKDSSSTKKSMFSGFGFGSAKSRNNKDSRSPTRCPPTPCIFSSLILPLSSLVTIFPAKEFHREYLRINGRSYDCSE